MMARKAPRTVGAPPQVGYDVEMEYDFAKPLNDRLSAARFASLDRNPVLHAISEGQKTPNDLGAVLLQYAFLPGVIAELLARGVVKLFRWQAVRDELLRNLGEELGSRSEGRTHFAILRDGLKHELELSAGSIEPSDATLKFIDALRTQVSDSSSLESAGALFALEDSAVPELRVVARLINLYAQEALGRAIVEEKNLGTVVPEVGNWTLDRFLAAHIGDFEVGHRDFLADALAPHVSGQDGVAAVQRGFDSTLALMETWWLALATS
jgi:hypothetical protein